jgi:hypothetical protein
MTEPEGPQMMLKHGAYTLHAGYAKLRKRTRMHTLTRLGTHTTHNTRRHTQMYM